MIARTDLPLSVDDVTAAWLGAALSAPVREATVIDVVWGTATKVLLDVAYDGDAGELPSRLCVKGGFVPELRAVMAPGYRAEARFYRDVAPVLGAGLPRCWYAEEEDEQGIVVLDDLAAADASFCDARQPLTIDQAADALEVLAGWHARGDLAFDWLDAPPHFRPMVQGLLRPEHWDAHVGQASSDPVRELLADRDRIVRAFTALWRAADRRPATFVHGDANLTNVYIDSQGSPRFLDWQFACRSDAYHDVGLFLIGALSTEDRRAHERPLLEHYLSARGATADSFDDAWTAYRHHTLHGAMYSLTPEAMQPAAIRAALADRHAQAAIDHQTLQLLGV